MATDLQSLPKSVACAWVYSAREQLAGLRKYEANWNSYGGHALRADVDEAARRLVDILQFQELPEPAVVLGSAGTVQFEWVHEGRRLEIELLVGHELGYLQVFENGRTHEAEVAGNIDDLAIRLAKWLLWG